MGEGMDNDAEIMPLIDACNIACGGHAGDEDSMNETVLLARQHQVKIGAHPSFPDLDNFGRLPMEMEPDALTHSLMAQIKALQSICQSNRTQIAHIKPHGALYNMAAKDETLAEVIVEVIKSFPRTQLFAPWESALAKKARAARIQVVYEAFADRRYLNDGTLVDRSNPKAIILRPELAMAQILSIITHDRVIPIEGEGVDIKASTFCVHGDNPNVIQILGMLNDLKE